jgi:DHA1 family bicyclomycin/chloramphenicol resistance-like MFS transporter
VRTPPHLGFIVFFVGLLLSFQPLSTDLYLPSLPAITQDLGLSVVQSQGTLLGLLLGFALSQLAWGMYSDRTGRRHVLLMGAALYTVCALVCASAASGPILLVARISMGCGLAAMVVCGRALIRDLFDTQAGQQAFAKALTVMAISATLSGAVGGWLAQHVPWRLTLTVLAGLGLMVCVLTWWRFDESHRPAPQASSSLWAHMLGTWRRLLSSRAFLLNTGLAAFTYTEAILFIGGSSLVLIQRLGVAPHSFGWMMTAYSACFLTGTMLCRIALRRAGRSAALKAGLLLSSLGMGAFLLISVDVLPLQVHVIVAAQMLYMLGHGFNQVCSQAGAVAPFPAEAGAAAALSGTLMILCTVCMGQLQALMLHHSPHALTGFAAFNALMVMGFLSALLRHGRRGAAG